MTDVEVEAPQPPTLVEVLVPGLPGRKGDSASKQLSETVDPGTGEPYIATDSVPLMDARYLAPGLAGKQLAETAATGADQAAGRANQAADDIGYISGAVFDAQTAAGAADADRIAAEAAAVQAGALAGIAKSGRTPAISGLGPAVLDSKRGSYIVHIQADNPKAVEFALVEESGIRRNVFTVDTLADTVSIGPGYTLVADNLSVAETPADLVATRSFELNESASFLHVDYRRNVVAHTLPRDQPSALVIGADVGLLGFDTRNNVLRLRAPVASDDLPDGSLVQDPSGFLKINGVETTSPTPGGDTVMASAPDGPVSLPALTSFDPAYATRTNNEAATFAMTGDRAWACWYSLQATPGAFAEDQGNYLVVAYSDDEARAVWTEAGYILPRNPLTERVFDPMITATPEGELLILYGQVGGNSLWDEQGGIWTVKITNPRATAGIFNWSEHHFLADGIPGRPRIFGNELRMVVDCWLIGTQYPLHPERAGQHFCRLITSEPVPRVERISTIPTAGAAYTARIDLDVMTVTAVEAGSLVAGLPVERSGVNPATVILEQLTGPAGGPGTYRVSISQSVPSRRMTSLIDYFETQVVQLQNGGVLAQWRTTDGPYESRNLEGGRPGAWSAPTKFTAFPMPSSRHSIGLSPSGRHWIMFNHSTSRTNGSVAWSDDGYCQTWSAPVTFDTNNPITYFVMDFDSAGNLLGAYDYGRGQGDGTLKRIPIVKASEASIIAGTPDFTITLAAA